MISPHWSGRAAYLRVDLGEHAIFTALPPNPERVRTTAEIVRVGISYHFNAPVVAPVVAKDRELPRRRAARRRRNVILQLFACD